MKDYPSIYKPFPFWSWNDELDEKELVRQIDWMHDSGIGGFFMHARGGLTTPYLGEKWFSCVEACLERAKELGMEAYAYDENGWPSGFCGGKLLEDEANRDAYLTCEEGPYDDKAFASYDVSGETAKRVTSGSKCLNVYLHISTSTADICNKDVVRKFIDSTHELYKKHDKYGNLRGFFTDEPQYYRWGTPWTRVLPDYFKAHYDEDIMDRLVLLFAEKEGYRDFRYKYWKAMQDLMLNSFGRQVYEWCDQNGYKLTGHYVEEVTLGYQMMCCGGIMPFYEYEHIPGVDWLGRWIGRNNLAPKQVSSVAAQTGKKQVMTECFACVGWDTTPLELKHIAEYLMVNGVNILCHHLLPYSEHGQRKRDYPEHYSKVNPWVEKDYRMFNDYFTDLGMLLANSTEIANVGVLIPLRSCYFNYKRHLEGEGFGVRDIDDGLDRTLNRLSNLQISHQFLDETIMKKHAKVVGNRLVVGKCVYEYVVLPEVIFTMDESTEALLREYVANGGRILLMGEKPSYLEGKPFDYPYLSSNITLEEIRDAQDFTGSENKNIRIAYRKDSEGKPFLFAVNTGEATDVTFDAKGYRSYRERNGNVHGKTVHFGKYASKVLYFSNETPSEEKKLLPVHFGKTFTVKNPVRNYLAVDQVAYSTDGGKTYSVPQYCMSAFHHLLESRYNGELFLKYGFDVNVVPSECELLIEDMHNLEVKVNGTTVRKTGTSYEKDLWVYDIASALKTGRNEIVARIDFRENETVYYALFGKDVQESIRNCLAYPTTIEGIYLRGNFGVEGDYQDGKGENIVTATRFAIGEQKKEITALIRDGYPFFRGNIVLEQEITVDDVRSELVIDGRFQMMDIYVNDRFVTRSIFDYRIDLSDYLKKGKNKITIELSVSNRNLMGVHHANEEEPGSIGPYSFERFGTWDEKGKSPLYKERYSFVKTIL